MLSTVVIATSVVNSLVRRKAMQRVTAHPCPDFLGKVFDGLLLYGIIK
ncbi:MULTISPECIES: hypothetical protein [Clostridium]|uniref:Uncharacterized protein n=1 Tax=Clostridium frigoriphilum TaxID=443253 RepID=A0ABU7UWW8_9CLOT|nr:hypothetical protein [Clostridium sp. DSM 17811]MBU3102267.1 hypothetical protein [Clostridium sp. DSM 17811]